jgi:hypothetical protein
MMIDIFTLVRLLGLKSDEWRRAPDSLIGY